MKGSTKFTNAIHTMVMIHLGSQDDRIDLSSNGFAKSIDTNPAFIRQLMSPLKKAGLIASVPGHATPHLCRAPEDITLFEIYEAVEQEKSILRVGTFPNPECGVGVNIQYAIQNVYDDLNVQVMNTLKSITLRDVIDGFRSFSGTTPDGENLTFDIH